MRPAIRSEGLPYIIRFTELPEIITAHIALIPWMGLDEGAFMFHA